jgi:hypothetical protein
MIRFVVHAAHRLTMLPYLERWAGAFGSHIEMVSYDQMFRTMRLPLRAHVFTDIERLGAEDLERAAKLFEALRAASPDLPLLNHPLRVRRRYELLRTLHDAGINDFNVYRLSEARKPRRFPVFLRSENDHAGPETDLIMSQADLDVAVEALAGEGKSRETRIAVEYSAEPGMDGLFRKYAAFCIDGEVIPRHVMFSKGWLVKGATKTVTEATEVEQRAYSIENPHADWVRSVFELARIDYGRIDYGIVAGRFQVFEINSNATIVPAEVTVRSERNEHFTALLTRAFENLEKRGEAAARSRSTVRLDEPILRWSGRMASLVLEKTFRRQLRRPI